MKNVIFTVKRIPTLLLILFGLFLIYCIFIAEPMYSDSQIRGTYMDNTSVSQCLFAYDLEEGDFYYTEDYNGVHIAGTIKSLEDGTYFVSCNLEKNKEIIPDQTITFTKNKYLPRKKELILNIREEEQMLIKTDSAVVLIGGDVYE